MGLLPFVGHVSPSARTGARSSDHTFSDAATFGTAYSTTAVVDGGAARADGTIPEEDQAILRTIGSWLSINGDAIYGTRPWKTYGEGPTKVESGGFKDSEPWGFTEEDIRFTTKNGAIYATVLAEPTRDVLIRSLGQNLGLLPGEIATVELLGTSETPSWERRPDGLLIHLPSQLPSPHAVVFKVTPA